MMTEQLQEQEKGYKRRLVHHKQYINNIKHQINYYQTHHQTIPTTLEFFHPPSPSRPVYQPRLSQIKQQKLKLQLQIAKKEKILCGLMPKNEKHSNQMQIMPYLLKVYCSRIKSNQNLVKLPLLLQQHDWEHCGLYQQQDNKGLVLVGTQLLTVSKINYVQIENQSLEIEGNYVRFSVNLEQKYYTFNFPTHSQAHKWHHFFTSISSVDHTSLSSKWLSTQVKLTNMPKHIPRSRLIQEVEPEQKNRKLQPKVQPKVQPSGQNLVSRLRLNIKRNYQRKQETDKSSFYLSNSSNKDNSAHPHVADQLNTSFQFQPTLSKQRTIQDSIQLGPIEVGHRDNNEIKIYSNEVQKKPDPLALTTKLLTKLQQKKRLLNDSSATRLGIHWHEDVEQKVVPQEHDSEQYISSPLKILSHHKSVSSRNNQISTRRDSNQNQSPLKRVQSATRYKSNSKQSQELSAKRKKTDFSLQLQKVESSVFKKKSSKQEIKIRDHYLQKLIQKQTIKEVSKSSGKDSSSQIQRSDNLLLPIPETRRKKPSQAFLSRHGSVTMGVVGSEDDSLSDDQKSSTELQIQIQELKNGIVLQKCSKKAWSTKQKKLYISNAMTQICYCDVHNSHEQKKYFIKDIKSIEYGRISKGILKHKKKRCDQGRCLLIRIDNNGQQKLLQFYLDESQAVQNLQEFSKKLQSYVQEHNQKSENESD